MKVSASAPGKLIILGEYAVLEGASAVVAAVDKFAHVTIEDSLDSHFILNASNLGLTDIQFNFTENQTLSFTDHQSEKNQKKLQLFYRVILNISKNIKLLPCQITINTSDFYDEDGSSKIGLGSSAALTVALVDAIYKFNHIPFKNRDALFKTSLNAHFEAQNKIGSGIDIAASTFRGLGIFENRNKNFSYCNISLPNDLYIIPVWTGSSTSTPKFVAKTQQLKKNNIIEYNQIMNQLISLSDLGGEYLKNQKTSLFLETINQFSNALDALGKSADIPIISEKHQQIAKIIKSCQGYYKPSGAGGNDIGIAFTNDRTIKSTIINEIEKSDFKYIKLDIVKHN